MLEYTTTYNYKFSFKLLTKLNIPNEELTYFCMYISVDYHFLKQIYQYVQVYICMSTTTIHIAYMQ